MYVNKQLSIRDAQTTHDLIATGAYGMDSQYIVTISGINVLLQDVTTIKRQIILEGAV